MSNSSIFQVGNRIRRLRDFPSRLQGKIGLIVSIRTSTMSDPSIPLPQGLFTIVWEEGYDSTSAPFADWTMDPTYWELVSNDPQWQEKLLDQQRRQAYADKYL